MSILKDLKTITGLNSEQLAQFTGLTRSHITMAESGLRELPAVALLKISRLLHIAETEAEKVSQQVVMRKTNKDEHKKLVLKLETHAAKCRLKAEKIKKQMDFCQAQIKRQEVLHASIAKCNAEWSDMTGEDRLWLASVQATLNQQKRRQQPHDLQALEHQLLLLEAQATATENSVAHIRKNIE